MPHKLFVERRTNPMTYVERINSGYVERGLNPAYNVVDWNEVLSKPAPAMLSDEYIRLCDLASSWVTCACGTQCAIIPRFCLGSPKDQVLAEYGSQFFFDIKGRDWPNALETLKKIEARSQELIAEILHDEQEASEAQRTCQ